MAGIRRLAGIRQLVVTKMVENDNGADTGTNAGRVKGEFLFSYFVRQVYVFRYPTAHAHPWKTLDWRGKRGESVLVLGFFGGEKISAVIRHMFQSCVAYFFVHRQTSSVPPKETILHYLRLLL